MKNSVHVHFTMHTMHAALQETPAIYLNFKERVKRQILKKWGQNVNHPELDKLEGYSRSVASK